MRHDHFRSCALTCLLATTAIGAAAAQRHLFPPFQSTIPNSGMGAGLTQIGDVNADGHRDWAAGLPAANNDAGAVNVYSGRTYVRLRTVLGPAASRFGASVAALGDVDGDGYDDWIAGGPGAGPSSIGFIRVVSGRTGLPIREYLGVPSTQFGFAVASAGDLNADGVPDYAVGAPRGSSTSPLGVVQFFSGRTGVLLNALVGFDLFGSAILHIGDVDVDGVPDFAIGRPGEAPRSGSVVLVSGRLMSPFQTLTGSGPGDRFGASIDIAGEINGFGLPELLIGAPGDGASGATYVYTMFGQLQHNFIGSLTATEFGASVARIDDLDLDGIPDYAVGVPAGFDHVGGSRTGAISIHSGRTGATLGYLAGSVPGGRFGTRVARLDDADGDGIAEILVSAPNVGNGEVYIVTFDFAGGSVPFGSACPGAQGFSDVTATGVAIGRPLNVLVRRLPPGALGTLVVGFSDQLWQGLQLPFDLTPFGFIGCSLLVGVDAQLPTMADTFGVATVSFSLRNDPSLVGDRFYLQHLAIDSSRPGGVSLSNGAAVTVGY